eukprot:g5791.t1
MPYRTDDKNRTNIGGAQLVESEREFNRSPSPVGRAEERDTFDLSDKKKKKKKKRTAKKKSVFKQTTDLGKLALTSTIYNGVLLVLLIVAMATKGWLRESDSDCNYGLFHYSCPKYNRSGRLTGDCKQISDGVLSMVIFSIFGFIASFVITLLIVLRDETKLVRSKGLLGFMSSFIGWLLLFISWLVYAIVGTKDCLRNYARERGPATRYVGWSFILVVLLWLLYTPVPTLFLWLLRADPESKKKYLSKKKKRKGNTDAELGLEMSKYASSEGKTKSKSKKTRATELMSLA